jgi:hypothetical protein
MKEHNLALFMTTGSLVDLSLISNKCSWQLWAVSRGCSLLHGTRLYLCSVKGPCNPSLIPPLIYSEVRVRPFSDLYFLLRYWLLIVIFFPFHCIWFLFSNIVTMYIWYIVNFGNWFLSQLICTDWQLVFHAVRGNGESVLDTWNRKAPYTCTPNTGCLPPGFNLEHWRDNNKHLRSPLIDEWNSLNIRKVCCMYSQERKISIPVLLENIFSQTLRAHGQMSITFYNSSLTLPTLFLLLRSWTS